MIDETVILLTPFEDCSKHKLAKHTRSNLIVSVPIDVCFYQPIKNIFKKAILYDYWKRIVEIGLNGINKEIIELVRREHPKYVLWVAIGEYYEIEESTFVEIRNEGSVIVGWFFDVDIRFDYYSKWWVPYIDYFVTDDVEAVPKFRKLGAWAMQAVCTGKAMELDWSSQNEIYEMSFVGSLRANRKQYLNEIKNRNLPITLFGLSWGKFASHEEMLKIFAGSRINLNFSMNYTNAKLAIKARIFEVCLAGGFLLTEYFPGIEDYFEIDKEIVCFRNAEEMVEKIKYYLNNDEERRAIAKAGWERATNEYSSFHIMHKIFQEIEKDVASCRKSEHQELSMPMDIKKRVSEFYLEWEKAFFAEDYKYLGKDAMALSLSSNPRSVGIWFWSHFYYVVSLSPFFIRSSYFKFSEFSEKFYKLLSQGLASIPYLRKIKRRFIG